MRQGETRQDTFESDLRKKLEGFELPVDDGVWAAISSRMRQERRVARRMRLMRYVTLGVAASVSLLLVVSLPWTDGGRETESAVSEIRKEVGRNHPAVPAMHQEEAGFMAQNTAGSTAGQPENNLQVSQGITVGHVADVGEVAGDAATASGTDSISVPPAADGQESGGSTADNAVRSTPQRGVSQPLSGSRQQSPRHGSGSLTASVYGFGVGSQDGNGGNVAVLQDVAYFGWQNTVDISASKVMAQEEVTKASHDFPIRLGASVRVPLSDRLGVESGLRYTILNSTIRNMAYGTEVKQRVGYIGIPVNVVCNLLTAGGFSAYVSGGGEAAMSIMSHNDDGTSLPRQWQFSANAALGAQYNITKTIGIFIEPGIGYYFKNNSSVETYYTEHPASFTLLMGLRGSIK